MKNKYGNINLNKSVFSSIALNVIEEDENVKLVEGNKPFKGGIVTKIDDNQLTLTVPVKVRQTYLMFVQTFKTRSLKAFLI